MYPELDRQDLRRVQKLEDDVIPAVVEMEKNGAPLDMDLVQQYRRECQQAYESLLWDISREAGFAFEHTAKGWAKLLDHLHLPQPESYDEAALSLIKHPLVQKGQFASQHASLMSKTFDAYLAHAYEGVLYYDINQLVNDDGGTVSGRFSIGYVQQVPNADNHRSAFGDLWYPRRVFRPLVGDYLEADAMQIEYRLFAHYANNPDVLAAYREDPRLSFHKMSWAMMKKYKPDMLYTHQKSFNFAKQYGAKSIRLAHMMGFITEKEGEEIRAAKRWDDPRLAVIHEIEAAYKKMMPEGDMLLDRASHLAMPECTKYCRKGDALHRQYRHQGYVRTITGRRSRFPNGYKTYIGLNRVIQGSGADIMKVKLAELHAARKTTGLLMRMTVHDAVGGDAQQPETKQRVAEILNRQSFPELKVPILWDCNTGRTWADCK
jgi:DNA polymerase I-like protein with 3'-5' exonuclease and polymerase domains